MDNTQNPTPLEDDIDDVEAHGFKEVAVGIGAAAILGGASAGAALAATSQPVGHGPGTKVVHSVQQTEQSATQAMHNKTPAPPPDATENQTRTPAQKPLLPKVKTSPVTPPAVNMPVGRNLDQTVNAVKNTTQKTVTVAQNTEGKVLQTKHTPPPNK